MDERTMRRKGLSLLMATAGLLGGCARHPSTVTPVSGFNLDRYLGTWYEIARLDHSFERGLTNVSATYSLNPDGSVRVFNRGFKPKRKAWKSIVGRAAFADSPDRGMLKVTFFRPFSASYVVFDLDDDYRHAFVCGPNTRYLWLLARTPEVSPALLERFRDAARQAGFPVEDLILVHHGQDESDAANGDHTTR